MADVHFVLQGKGGVGKSVTAALKTQQLLASGKTVLSVDTDPINATFSGYKGIGAQYIQIMEDDEINPRLFDQLIELICSTDCEAVMVDNGAASFVALANYIKSNHIVEMLTELGHRVCIHTVITAGQAQKDTLVGFKQLAEAFRDSGAELIVWLNEFWGPIRSEEGKVFEEMKVYRDNEDAISAVIVIPELKPKETFADTMSKMLTKKLTFDEAIGSSEFLLMEKQRLKSIKDKLFNNISIVA